MTSLLKQYFDSLQFYQLEKIDLGHVLYGASLVNNIGEYQYVLLSVINNNAFRNVDNIYNLDPVSIGMNKSKIPRYPSLKPQTWSYHRSLPDIDFEVEARSKQNTRYSCVTPPYIATRLILLHNPEKNTEFQYPAKYSLRSAIETRMFYIVDQ